MAETKYGGGEREGGCGWVAGPMLTIDNLEDLSLSAPNWLSRNMCESVLYIDMLWPRIP